nr:zinc finger protein 182 isoform X1 [Ciona intestinalis]|eukprot:XP_026692227.1 zinc finger protein 182 isoform X1 [Ciona intestinalis]
MKHHTKHCVKVVSGSYEAGTLMKYSHDPTTFTCILDDGNCDVKCKKQHEMCQHLLNTHGITSFPCKYCPAVLKDSASLQSHKLLHQTYICLYCDYSTTSKNRFVKHYFQKHGTDFKCSFCNKKCNSKFELDSHETLHILQPIDSNSICYKCLLCSYVTPHQEVSLLKKHIMRKHVANETFQCTKCSYTCNEKSQLNLHMRKHSQEKPYLCQLCGFMCKWSSQMNLHQAYHTGLKLHKCPHCQYKSYRADTLKIHLKHKHGFARTKLCDKCGYAATCASAFKVHVAGHSKQRPYTCQFCRKTYKTRGNLRAHQRKAHKELVRIKLQSQTTTTTDIVPAMLPCHQNNSINSEPLDIIGAEVDTESIDQGEDTRPKPHLHSPSIEEVHNPEAVTTLPSHMNPISCSFCSHQAKSLSALYKHMCGNHKKQSFECTQCNVKMKYLSQFLVHRFKHENIRLFPCAVEQCDYVGLTKKHLQMHSRRHSDDMKYKCEQCNFTCKWSNMLTLHELQKHFNKKKYECNLCEYKSFRKDLLQQHTLNKHSNHRPHTCTVCGNSFKHRGTLLMHYNTHKNNREWVCDQCGKRFKTKRVLETHRKTHTVGYLFRCNFCKFRSNDKTQTINHHKKHLLAFTRLPFQCNTCEYAANTMKILNAHKKKKHSTLKVPTTQTQQHTPTLADHEQPKQQIQAHDNHPKSYEDPWPPNPHYIHPVFTQLVTVTPNLTPLHLPPSHYPNLPPNQEYGSRGPVMTTVHGVHTPLPSSTSLLPSNTILLAGTSRHENQTISNEFKTKNNF